MLLLFYYIHNEKQQQQKWWSSFDFFKIYDIYMWNKQKEEEKKLH